MTSPQTNGGGKRSAARWPDLLIGLLVVLLLGGFGVLLFGQRPSNTANTAPTTPAEASPAPTESAEIPAAPGTTTVTPAPTEAQTEIPPVTGQTAEQPGAQAQTPSAQIQTPATTPATPVATTPEAATPETAPAQTETATTPPTTPSATTTTPTASLDDIPTIVAAPVEPASTAQPATPAATTDPATPVSPAARTGGAVATSETRTPLRSDYRISLGTFASEATANSRTAGVSGLGYRVYPIDLGSEVVAQIGPFADEATARQALADVQRAYPGAILYPPRNRSLTGGTVSGTAPASTAPSTTTPAPTSPAVSAPVAPTPVTPTPQAAAPAPTGPVYLQVGAFDRVEGAQNLVGTLREQGFAPTVNAPEGRKVTVLVGPFSGDALTRAEERLSSSGLDSFRVR